MPSGILCSSTKGFWRLRAYTSVEALEGLFSVAYFELVLGRAVTQVLEFGLLRKFIRSLVLEDELKVREVRSSVLGGELY